MKVWHGSFLCRVLNLDDGWVHLEIEDIAVRYWVRDDQVEPDFSESDVH